MVAHPEAVHAAVYTRISSDRQRDNYSPESQLRLGMELADTKSYTVSPEHIFQEVWTGKESGDERPQLQRLKAEVLAGRVKVVIGLKADRMFRDILDGMTFSEFLRAKNARLELVLGTNDPSPLGQVMYALELYQAESGWDALREATERGMNTRIASGKPRAGAAPLYGYRWEDPLTKERHVIHEPEAAVVRRVYRHLVEGGTLTGLAIQFRAENLPSPTGKHWLPSTLSKLVRHDAYAGRAYANRFIVIKLGEGRKNSKLRPRNEWVRLPDDVTPAIVDQETWARANSQLDRNRTTEGARNLRNPERFLLRGGHAVCARCGSCMSAQNRKNRSPIYHCSQQWDANANTRCGGTSISAADLDAAVWEKMSLVLLDPDWVRQYLSQQTDTAIMDADLAAVKAEMASVAKRRSGLTRNLGMDEDTDAILWQELNALKTRQSGLQAKHDSITARRTALHRAEDLIDSLASRGRVLDSMTYPEKRALVNEFAVRATVFPASAESRFHIDMAYDLDGWEADAITGEEPRTNVGFALQTASSRRC